MPDVKSFLKDSIELDELGYDFEEELAQTVALNMSCRVGWLFWRKFKVVDPHKEVDVTTIGKIDGRSGSVAIIEVAAYALRDRMRNIDVRLAQIAERMHYVLGLDEDQHVSITFIRVHRRCWAKA